jgi:DNA replication protein DnaC
MDRKNPTNGQAWSPTNIYLSGSGPIPPRIGPTAFLVASKRFTREFIDAFLAEQHWDLLDDLPSLTPEDIDAIVNRGLKCPICTEGRDWPRYRGRDSAIVICLQVDHGCKHYVRIGMQWRKLVDDRYLRIRLDDLEPSGLSRLPKIRQAEYIETLQQNPDSSYMFAGESGMGKTHFGYALAYDAVERWSFACEENPQLGEQSVFWVDTSDLLDSIQKYKKAQQDQRPDDDPPKPPAVTADQITRLAKLGHKVCLILEEFDKFSPTQPRLDNLHDVVGAIYKGKGQVIAISNDTVEVLKEKWRDFSSNGPILRRIAGPEANNGSELEFFVE